MRRRACAIWVSLPAVARGVVGWPVDVAAMLPQGSWFFWVPASSNPWETDSVGVGGRSASAALVVAAGSTSLGDHRDKAGAVAGGGADGRGRPARTLRAEIALGSGGRRHRAGHGSWAATTERQASTSPRPLVARGGTQAPCSLADATAAHEDWVALRITW